MHLFINTELAYGNSNLVQNSLLQLGHFQNVVIMHVTINRIVDTIKIIFNFIYPAIHAIKKNIIPNTLAARNIMNLSFFINYRPNAQAKLRALRKFDR